MTVLGKYTLLLEAQMGAILANSLVKSKQSTHVIRELSKQLDSTSVALRKELIELDRSLVITND